ncbi:MAG: M28 family peptidase, partial [Bacteroidota bacterium]
LMFQEGSSGMAEAIQKGKHKVQLDVAAVNRKPINSRNVIGKVEGTDPELKNEHLIVTAHFDHVGTGAKAGGPFSPEDSIFNGARDNAIGTTTLLGTAKHIAANPLKRTVVFLAVTGEELGLLGSSYYTDNPLIPLEQTIFNFNTDGAGYNKTDRVTLFGYDRTGTLNELNTAAERYGLIATDDPAPEQGLFDRSDNVNFARKGVPCLTYSMGFDAFDDEINKYYHQVGDHADNLDYEYLEKYSQSFIAAVILIASKEEVPMWKKDDKYYEAAKELYGLED